MDKTRSRLKRANLWQFFGSASKKLKIYSYFETCTIEYYGATPTICLETLSKRVLLQLGASFLPIARLLPVKLLLEVLNFGLAQDIGSKVTGAVAKSLDERFKEAITGDAKYQLGDASKKQLSSALSKFTGKESYSFGDISQLVATRLSETSDDKSDGIKATTKAVNAVLEELANDDALAKWDKKFVDETNTGKDTPTKR